MSGLEIVLLLPIIAIILAVPPAIQSIGHGMERAQQKVQHYQHERAALHSYSPCSHPKLFSMELAQLWWKEVTTPKSAVKRRKEHHSIEQNRRHAEPCYPHITEKQMEHPSLSQGSRSIDSESATSPSPLPRRRFILLIPLFGALWTYLSFLVLKILLKRYTTEYCSIIETVSVPGTGLWLFSGLRGSSKMVELRVGWRGGIFCWLVSCISGGSRRGS